MLQHNIRKQEIFAAIGSVSAVLLLLNSTTMPAYAELLDITSYPPYNDAFYGENSASDYVSYTLSSGNMQIYSRPSGGIPGQAFIYMYSPALCYTSTPSSITISNIQAYVKGNLSTPNVSGANAEIVVYAYLAKTNPFHIVDTSKISLLLEKSIGQNQFWSTAQTYTGSSQIHSSLTSGTYYIVAYVHAIGDTSTSTANFLDGGADNNGIYNFQIRVNAPTPTC